MSLETIIAISSFLILLCIVVGYFTHISKEEGIGGAGKGFDKFLKDNNLEKEFADIKEESQENTCPLCGGAGETMELGFLVQCSRCGGSGKV